MVHVSSCPVNFIIWWFGSYVYDLVCTSNFISYIAHIFYQDSFEKMRENQRFQFMIFQNPKSNYRGIKTKWSSYTLML
jgi:hypothetical protein